MATPGGYTQSFIVDERLKRVPGSLSVISDTYANYYATGFAHHMDIVYFNNDNLAFPENEIQYNATPKGQKSSNIWDESCG